MTKKPGNSDIVLLSAVIVGVVVAATALMAASQSYNGARSNGTYPGNIVLNVYIDEGGKALITGYADSIDGLVFLKGSQYKYDNNTKQLYALTNSLTDKSGDDWETTLPTQGNYSEYHSIFYLPASARISKINSSPGLDYIVSAGNDSFQVDFHGYDVKGPTITMDYQLPLQGASSPGAPGTMPPVPLTALLGAVLVALSLFLWISRRGKPQSDVVDHAADSVSQTGEPTSTPGDGQGAINQADETNQRLDVDQSETGDYFVEVDDHPEETDTRPSATDENPTGPVYDFEEPSEKGEAPIKLEGELKRDDGEVARDEEGRAQVSEGTAIEITSEMAAVMETLTARERSVLSTLIEHNGKMNQADIRYETGIPKSSLTGILLSLERRKLITKKEKGRTNAIELSDWFLSKKEPSGQEK